VSYFFSPATYFHSIACSASRADSSALCPLLNKITDVTNLSLAQYKKIIEEKAGNVVVIAGNNKEKTEYIK